MEKRKQSKTIEEGGTFQIDDKRSSIWQRMGDSDFDGGVGNTASFLGDIANIISSVTLVMGKSTVSSFTGDSTPYELQLRSF